MATGQAARDPETTRGRVAGSGRGDPNCRHRAGAVHAVGGSRDLAAAGLQHPAAPSSGRRALAWAHHGPTHRAASHPLSSSGSAIALMQRLLQGRALYLGLGVLILTLYWRATQQGPAGPPPTV